MSDSPEELWSVYLDVKMNFAGVLVGSVLYGTPKTPSFTHSSICTHSTRSITLGIIIMLVFKCVTALLNPVYRREPIKWGLVSYTIVAFSFVTVLNAVALHIQSISYIDNRQFPGIQGVISPGPIGYVILISHEAFAVVPTVMFFLNGWLADGILVRPLFDAAFIH